MEMISPALVQFSFFIALALLGTLVSMKLRQPYVVGLLILGVISGPNFLGIVKDSGLISIFSELGAILLLFSVGIEFSLSRIAKSGVRAFLVTLFKMGILFFFAYETAILLGFSLTVSLFIGAMLSITSTAIMFKMVSEKKAGKNAILPLLFSMLIFEDIIAVGAITFFSALSASAAPSYSDKAYSLFISMGILGAFYFIIRRRAAGAIYRLTASLNPEIMIFISFSLCLILSMVAGFFGLSPTIGAFLAGSIISSLPNSKAIERSIKPLVLTFSALFFLSLGMRVEPSVLLLNIAPTFALIATFAVSCFAAVFLLAYLTGSSGRQALFGASAMVVLGEFSLIIASISGDAAPLLISICSLGVIITSALSSFLLDRQEKLHSLLSSAVPGRMVLAAGRLSEYFTGLLRDFSPRGSFWKVSVSCWACLHRKIAYLATLLIALGLSHNFVDLFGLSPQMELQMRGAIAILLALPIIYFSLGILSDLRPILDALSRSIARHKEDSKTEQVLLIDVLCIIGLIILSFNLPEAVAYFQLPSFFGLGAFALIAFSLAFAWDFVKNAAKLHRKRRLS